MRFKSTLKEGDAAPKIALGNTDHQPKIRADDRPRRLFCAQLHGFDLALQHSFRGQMMRQGCSCRHLVSTIEVRGKPLGVLRRQKIQAQEYGVCLADHAVPQRVMPPQAARQEGPQIGGPMSIPAVVQCLGFLQDCEQVGHFLL